MSEQPKRGPEKTWLEISPETLDLLTAKMGDEETADETIFRALSQLPD